MRLQSDGKIIVQARNLKYIVESKNKVQIQDGNSYMRRMLSTKQEMASSP